MVVAPSLYLGGWGFESLRAEMYYSGIVQKSSGEGARIGFPTANILLTDTSLSGIYAAEVIVEGKMHHAAVYADTRRDLLEAHLLDFNDDLYGQNIEIRIHKKIREDASFESEEELKRAIAKDVAGVRAFFKL